MADTNIILENFENFIGTAFNDRFIDKQGVENAYIGGDGLDVIDYSLWGVEEGVTVNLNDFEEDSDGNTLFSIEGVIGTNKDDTYIDNPNVNNFIGGGDGGIDTIDYSLRSSGIFVDMAAFSYDFERVFQVDGVFNRIWDTGEYEGGLSEYINVVSGHRAACEIIREIMFALQTALARVSEYFAVDCGGLARQRQACRYTGYVIYPVLVLLT